MLDEKIQDAEHSLVSVREESQEEKELIAGKVDELTTSLQNLKWGFKDRREFFFQWVFNIFTHIISLCIACNSWQSLIFCFHDRFFLTQRRQLDEAVAKPQESCALLVRSTQEVEGSLEVSWEKIRFLHTYSVHIIHMYIHTYIQDIQILVLLKRHGLLCIAQWKVRNKC